MKRSKKSKARNERDLSCFISDRAELARRVFLALKPSEVKAMAPNFAKKMPIEDIKALCLEELTNMSAKSLRAILSCAPALTTITLDSDSENSSSASSSETEETDTDSSESDKSDDTADTAEADVMVINDSDEEDVKDNKPVTMLEVQRKNSGTDKENEVVPENSICNGSNSENVTDQYVDRIKKLDMLTAKLGQEIEKLSKKKESSSKDFTSEYVNEMLSELTKINNDMSYEQAMKIRKDSEQLSANKNVGKSIKSQRKVKRTVMPEESDVETNRKQIRVAESSDKNHQELSNQTKKCNEDLIIQPNSSDQTTKTGKEEIRDPSQKTATSNITANVLADKNNDITSESEKVTSEATVCLLSDSDDSEDELQSELQQSISESRKHIVLSKEKRRMKSRDAGLPQIIKRNINNQSKPFCEEDIEIEIVVDGGPNIDNMDKVVKCCHSVKERKMTCVGKTPSKDSCESIVQDMIQQMDATKVKNIIRDSINQITILSSGSEDSDKCPSGPEDGEVDSSSDEGESSEIKQLHKKRSNNAGVVRITCKKVNGKDTLDVVDSSLENNREAGKSIDIASVERSNDDMRPQLKSAIVKVTDSDKLIETNTSQVKSVAVKIPHANENIKIHVGDGNIKTRILSNEVNVRPKEKDNITVVVNNTEDNTIYVNRIVKMTEDIKSVDSVVVAVTNKHNFAEVQLPDNASENTQDNRLNRKAKDFLKPVAHTCVAKVSDFVFVKPSDQGKPMLMARDMFSSQNKTNACHPTDMTEKSTFHNELDMDILEIDCSEQNNDVTNTPDIRNRYALSRDTEQINVLNNINETKLNHEDCVMRTEEPTVASKIQSNTESLNSAQSCIINHTNKTDTLEIMLLQNRAVNAEQVESIADNLDSVKSSTNTDAPLKSLADTVKSIITETDHKKQADTASEHLCTVNTESVMNHTQPDEVEPIPPESDNTQQNNINALAMQQDATLTISASDATVLDQVHQYLEEGELENTTELELLPPPNVGLEEGEIDGVTRLAAKALEDGELTDPSSSDLEFVEIPKELICISDEEPGQEKIAIGPETGHQKKKKNVDKKKKDERRRKKCTGKCKHKKKGIDNLIFDTEQLDSGDKSNVYEIEITSKDPTDILSEAISNATTEVKHLVHIDTIDKRDVKPIDVSKNTITDLSDLMISKETAVAEDMAEPMIESKESSQNVIDMLSIEISSDDSSDDLIFEDLEDLTAAIDGIETQQLAAQIEREEEDAEIENISWRDRYLGSKKVKKVLTTSNILNALRKKNKELKKKLQESKQVECVEEVILEPTVEDTQKNVEEGSIEHYNTLQGSTKFVDPVPDLTDGKPTETQTEETVKEPLDAQIRSEELPGAQISAGVIEREQAVLQTNAAGNVQENVTKEMKRDAKNLLKMYKKLLKYNDVNRRSDPNKKKSKKKKQKKDGFG